MASGEVREGGGPPGRRAGTNAVRAGTLRPSSRDAHVYGHRPRPDVAPAGGPAPEIDGVLAAVGVVEVHGDPVGRECAVERRAIGINVRLVADVDEELQRCRPKGL